MLKTSSLLLAVSMALSASVMAENKNYSSYWAKPKKLSFAVVADAPYGDENVGAFDYLIDDVNQDKSIKFVMHGGDIKSGGAECTDERLQARFDQYQKFKKPFIYTPGDNEWTDCHRTSNGAYNPIERLDYLRDLFYPNPGYSTGGKKMRLKNQSYYPGYEQFVENNLFKRSKVIFSTIHVVGSNNNLRAWSGIDSEDSFENPRADRLQEFLDREAASIAWLKETFAVAKRKNARGVFIMIHANPQFNLNETEDGRAGFNAFLDELFAQTKDFAKPVLLVHGDSHVFFTDKPKLVPWYADGNALSADDEQNFVPNLTRLQTFGDTPQHWVKVTVDPRTESLFVIEPQVVENNL